MPLSGRLGRFALTTCTGVRESSVTRARGRHGRRRPLAGLTVAALAVALAAGSAALTWASGAIQGPVSTSAASIPVTGNPLVNTLLARMSLPGKLRLLEWATSPGQPQAATLPGLRSLGIPALHLAEGPLGTARQPSAAMTAPLGVAATFSRVDAYANGVMLGRDARVLRRQALARPFGVLDTGAAGVPAGATFGEDPLLAGGTAAAEIAGIQAQGTMAVASGFPGGPGSGAAPSPAALHEIYLQPVEDAVRAGAAGILCSAARTGPGAAVTRGAPEPAGLAACGSPGLLTQILRSELGFTGFVLAGPGGNPGTLSLDSGVDGEIPAPGAAAARYFTATALRAAIASRTISVATVNQAVAAVLTEMDRFGLLGPRPAHRATVAPATADERIASRTAADAATLLKNSGNALPLAPAALASLALIGPGAGQVIGATGGQIGRAH